VLVAFVVTAVIDATSRVLARRRLPSFFRQVVGGFLATAATAGFFAIGVLPAGTEPALVVAAGITALLSGFAVVGTAQDAIGGAAHRRRPRAEGRAARGRRGRGRRGGIRAAAPDRAGAVGEGAAAGGGAR
jgi:hypothetical protein